MKEKKKKERERKTKQVTCIWFMGWGEGLKGWGFEGVGVMVGE